ncbi:MAG TPA: ABC transporter substrate-binding protein, partial [Syntrophorhabdaceae bacterium]|nr:ABC transporter substrate-binding protein [Syntrophorhabdaceae bacterium]
MKTMLCVMTALCLFLCIGGNAGAKDTVKIGLITPLTGDVKTYGESVKNAFTIAVEEYGRKGKYTIQTVMADDRNDATEGANAALKLITQDKVTAIVG